MNNKCKINFCIDNAESKGYCERRIEAEEKFFGAYKRERGIEK